MADIFSPGRKGCERFILSADERSYTQILNMLFVREKRKGRKSAEDLFKFLFYWRSLRFSRIIILNAHIKVTE
jgi:hypothetical protein